MENQKKIDVLFAVVVIAFLVVTIFLIKDFNAKRASDQKDYIAAISNIAQRKNDKIKILATQLAAKQKQYDELQQTLVETRNNLDALSKKLSGTNTPAVPATVPIAAPASTTATK